MASLEVTFHGLDPSDALAEHAQKHLDRLTHLDPRITRCRVAIERRNHRHRHGERTRFGLEISYGTAAWFAPRYLYPAKRPARMRSLFVGRLDAIADGDAKVIEDLRGVPVQIVRDGQKLRALSTVCPHLGCRVRWEGDKF